MKIVPYSCYIGQDNNGTNLLPEDAVHCSTEEETMFVLQSFIFSCFLRLEWN